LEVWTQNKGSRCAGHKNGYSREEGCSRLLVEFSQHTAMSNTHH
jgi:hypothetical protein